MRATIVTIFSLAVTVLSRIYEGILPPLAGLQTLLCCFALLLICRRGDTVNETFSFYRGGGNKTSARAPSAGCTFTRDSDTSASESDTGVECCCLVPIAALVSTSHFDLHYGQLKISWCCASFIASLAFQLVLGRQVTDLRRPSRVALIPASILALITALWTLSTLNATGLLSLVVLVPLLSLQWLVEWALPRRLPSSFTPGEAVIVGQGTSLFALSAGQLYWTSALQITDGLDLPVSTQTHLFVVTAVSSCALVLLLLALLPCLRGTVVYYGLVLGIILCVSLPVLAACYRTDFVSWLVGYLKKDVSKIWLFFYWLSACLASVAIVRINADSFQLSSMNQMTSTLNIYDTVQLPSNLVINRTDAAVTQCDNSLKHSGEGESHCFDEVVSDWPRKERTGNKCISLEDKPQGDNAFPKFYDKITVKQRSEGAWKQFYEGSERQSNGGSEQHTNGGPGQQINEWSRQQTNEEGKAGRQTRSEKRALTSVRKQFHALAVAVIVPGLLVDAEVTHMAVTCALIVLVMLESVRVLRVAPFGAYLDTYLCMFADAKDEGSVLLTHLYLLTGTSVPIWMLTGSATGSEVPLALFSGVLSVGVGDSAASIVGSAYGRHKWKGSRKSMEGSAASVVAQLLFIAALSLLCPSVAVVWWKAFTGVLLVSLLEAFTTQIDNLVLPLFLFSVLV